jgi:hypothetical protein
LYGAKAGDGPFPNVAGICSLSRNTQSPADKLVGLALVTTVWTAWTAASGPVKNQSGRCPQRGLSKTNDMPGPQKPVANGPKGGPAGDVKPGRDIAAHFKFKS